MRIAAEVIEKDLRIAVEFAAEHGLNLGAAALLADRGREAYQTRPPEGE
jgi:hypothetical protein